MWINQNFNHSALTLGSLTSGRRNGGNARVLIGGCYKRVGHIKLKTEIKSEGELRIVPENFLSEHFNNSKRSHLQCPGFLLFIQLITV